MYYHEHKLSDEGVWLINFWVVYLRTRILDEPNGKILYAFVWTRIYLEISSFCGIIETFSADWISNPITFQNICVCCMKSVRTRFPQQLQLCHIARWDWWNGVYVRKQSATYQTAWKQSVWQLLCMFAGNLIFDSTPWYCDCNLLQNHPIHQIFEFRHIALW